MKVLLVAILGFILLMVVFVGLMTTTANFASYDEVIRNLIEITLIIGFLAIFILPIIFFTYRALRDTHKSFQSERSSLTFREWLSNLIPFRPIKTLISQVYPNEKIIQKKICFDGFADLVKLGRLPVGFGYEVNFPFPAFLIETNASYYIDRRLQQILNGTLGSLFFYWLTSLWADNSIEANDIERVKALFLFAVIVSSAILILPSLFWQVGRIKVIRKSWLRDENKKGRSLVLTGTIPSNSQITLSTDKFVNTGSINIPFKHAFYLI